MQNFASYTLRVNFFFVPLKVQNVKLKTFLMVYIITMEL